MPKPEHIIYESREDYAKRVYTRNRKIWMILFLLVFFCSLIITGHLVLFILFFIGTIWLGLYYLFGTHKRNKG